MNKKIIATAGLVSAGVLAAGLWPTTAQVKKSPKRDTSKPNIIFILADDLGFAEISANGADKYRTPNIDRLASMGVRYTNGYTTPLSGPSRACILTGRYAFRTGATNQDAVGMLKYTEEKIMPTYLKEAGYATAMYGKWSQFPDEPGDWGFDDALRFQGSGIYWSYQNKGKTYTVNGKEVALKSGEYLPDIMHQHLTSFMEANKDRPFYVHYSLSHVHNDILPTPLSKAGDKDEMSLYNDNITYMDKLVGRLMDELDRLDLAKNTILVFLGDNGTAGAKAPFATIGGRRLIGQKGNMQEGGSLVPMIVYWPGVTPKGAVCNDLMVSVDFLPTFAEIAGVKLPSDVILDGKSFVGQLKGDKKWKPRTSFFMQLANMYYVRSKDYKLNEKNKLFDMSKAPFEEILVPADTKDPKAIAARKELEAELARLNPKGGHIDEGDGSGRHANKTRQKEEEGD